MGGVENDRELLPRPTVVRRQRSGVRRDQERFRGALRGGMSAFYCMIVRVEGD